MKVVQLFMLLAYIAWLQTCKWSAIPTLGRMAMMTMWVVGSLLCRYSTISSNPLATFSPWEVVQLPTMSAMQQQQAALRAIAAGWGWATHVALAVVSQSSDQDGQKGGELLRTIGARVEDDDLWAVVLVGGHLPVLQPPGQMFHTITCSMQMKADTCLDRMTGGCGKIYSLAMPMLCAL